MIPFAEVLALLEQHQWELFRIHPPYRIFYLYGDPETGLPILVEVHDGMVDDAHVERIRRILQSDGPEANEEGDDEDGAEE